MANLSSSQAAKKLGIPYPTLVHYIRVGKIPKPRSFTSGGTTVHVWSESDIEKVRKLLPKIINGRKTRWHRQREREKQAAPARVPAPHKKRKPMEK